MARERFQEAATLLHKGLALDGLDTHDAQAVVAGLCIDLVGEDPGTAVRARSQATLDAPEDMHVPEGVSAHTSSRRQSCNFDRRRQGTPSLATTRT